MSRLSPVEVDCALCAGGGWIIGDGWVLCRACDGSGKAWVPGAPSYGCKILLGSRKLGEIVMLGNGDRGRIVRHDKRSPATTSIALIGDFDGQESSYPTSYPSIVGVVSVSDPRWFTDDKGHAHGRQDATDPLRGKAT